MGFIFAVHVPIAGLALLPLLFGLPIVFSADPHRVPRDGDRSGVFARLRGGDGGRRRHAPTAAIARSAAVFGSLIGWSVLQGAVAFALVAAIFVIASVRGMPEAEVRALTFFSLVLTIVSLIFVNRSFSASLAAALIRPNRALVWVLLGVTTCCV